MCYLINLIDNAHNYFGLLYSTIAYIRYSILSQILDLKEQNFENFVFQMVVNLLYSSQ